MTPLEEFKTRYGEFVNPPATDPPTPAVPDDTIQYWIDDAVAYLGPNRALWGGCFDRAVLTYAAFNLAKAVGTMQDGPAGGVLGPVASASVGGESVSYANQSRFGQGTSSDDRYLMYPPYGPDFMKLRDEIIPGGTITGRCLHG